jgi:4-hydroxy-tetrahydrodipicolinate synthase
MTMKPYWRGVFPAVTTQMREDGALDLDATARHLEVLLDSGVGGLVMCGSLGENQALDPEEKRAVVEAAVGVASGRVPVLAGVAETSTPAACRYVADCTRLGADGFMVMSAMVYRGDEREIVTHFRSVASATDRPLMIYNNPVSYGNDVTPALFAELAAIDSIVAIKESSADTRRITDIRNVVGDRYAIFVGVDDLALESAVLGVDGWVAGTGLAFPYENQYLWDLTQQGDWEQARAVYGWYMPLLHLDTHPKLVQYIKLAIQENGLGAEWVRAPRLPLEGAEREQVLRVIREGIEARPALPAGYQPGAAAVTARG